MGNILSFTFRVFCFGVRFCNSSHGKTKPFFKIANLITSRECILLKMFFFFNFFYFIIWLLVKLNSIIQSKLKAATGIAAGKFAIPKPEKASNLLNFSWELKTLVRTYLCPCSLIWFSFLQICCFVLFLTISLAIKNTIYVQILLECYSFPFELCAQEGF